MYWGKGDGEEEIEGRKLQTQKSPAQLAGGSLQTGDKPPEVVSPPGF